MPGLAEAGSLTEHGSILRAADNGAALSDEEILRLAGCEDTAALMQVAAKLRDHAHLNTVSYSKKVFIPLTHLCRDVCHYCTFAQVPRKLKAPYLTPEEVLKIAEDGAKAGCKEALFTL